MAVRVFDQRPRAAIFDEEGLRREAGLVGEGRMKRVLITGGNHGMAPTHCSRS